MPIDGDETQRHHHRLLKLVCEISAMNVNNSGGELVFKKDCTDLIRRVSLLTYFVEEIKDFEGQFGNLEDGSSSSSGYWWFDLATALIEAKSLLLVARSFQSTPNSEEATEKIAFQFQCVTMKMEQALANIPYDQFEISEEVQEQVGLARTQLRRATERYGSVTGRLISFNSSEDISEEMDQVQDMDESSRGVDTSDNICVTGTLDCHSQSNDLESESSGIDEVPRELKIGHSGEEVNIACTSTEDMKKGDVQGIPQDFLCPISLELMRDPVIVTTGQTYERSFIQRWIDNGNATCPKTQEKLENSTLTPNYALRSLISQWCIDNNVEQPTLLANGRIRQSDGSFRDVSGDMEAIQALVQKLSSQSIEECKAAVMEIRSISKRSTDNRILLAEAGAIPLLVTLLASKDASIQENAVTSILNLSIYENNKGLIMLAGATPSIVLVLRTGSVKARENAAATLFSLSLVDENKIIIGASEAIPVLVELFEHGSTRGKKDAATALFNLCIYQRNRGRAVRAGIVPALLKMLTDTTNSMVDEALTIMSILASSQEAKVAMLKADAIAVLIDVLRTGLPRSKENATSILLSLCKRDPENLCYIDRLGAGLLLTDIARNGTDRAKRKATSLLEHIRKVQQN